MRARSAQARRGRAERRAARAGPGAAAATAGCPAHLPHPPLTPPRSPRAHAAPAFPPLPPACTHFAALRLPHGAAGGLAARRAAPTSRQLRARGVLAARLGLRFPVRLDRRPTGRRRLAAALEAWKPCLHPRGRCARISCQGHNCSVCFAWQSRPQRPSRRERPGLSLAYAIRQDQTRKRLQFLQMLDMGANEQLS